MDLLNKTASSDSLYIPQSSNWSSELDKAKKMSILAEEKKSAMVKLASASTYITSQDAYPSPFLNLSDMQIPRTMIEVLKWCRYFYKFDPIIAGAVNSLASFPVTEIIMEDMEAYQEATEDSPYLKMYEKMFFERLNMNKFLIEIGIDFWIYGNCFVFGEMANFSQDPKAPDIQWKHLTRLDPCRMIIDVDPLTQEKTFKWEVPPAIKKICTDKKPTSKYNAIPDVIKEAVKKRKAVVLNERNVYHFSRPSESGDGSTWGTPVVLNVLKLLMYRNVLRQAQEAIARDHTVPFRIYYLNPSEKYDPIGDWASVARAFAEQLKQAAKDPNYKVVSPIPVNALNLGGQGRALMLTPELELIQNEILAGMGVPREFIFGGVSYSGSSISLRILENQFVTYRLLLEDFMRNFIIKTMATVRNEWRSGEDDKYLIKIKLGELKMQDDVQQKQLLINLNAAGKVPDEEIYKMLGLDVEQTKRKLNEEMAEKLQQDRAMQMYQIDTQLMIQQKTAMLQMQLQAEQAKMLGVDHRDLVMGPEKEDKTSQNQKVSSKQEKPQKKNASEILSNLEKYSEDQQALGVARKLIGMPQTDRNIAMGKLPVTIQRKVGENLGKLDALKNAENATTDMRELPKIKPPRRQTTIV